MSLERSGALRIGVVSSYRGNPLSITSKLTVFEVLASSSELKISSSINFEIEISSSFWFIQMMNIKFTIRTTDVHVQFVWRVGVGDIIQRSCPEYELYNSMKYEI